MLCCGKFWFLNLFLITIHFKTRSVEKIFTVVKRFTVIWEITYFNTILLAKREFVVRKIALLKKKNKQLINIYTRIIILDHNESV